MHIPHLLGAGFALLFGINNLLAQTYQKNWIFEPNTNTLKNAKIIREKGSVDMVYLEFTSSKKQQLALFTTQSATAGVYKKTFHVNGKTPFSGELEGRDSKGRLAFQVVFKDGVRIGEFLTLSEKGDTQRMLYPTPAPPVQPIEIEEDRKPQMLKKPVIYLYPQTNTQVTVKLPNSEKDLAHTYPKYNPATGWQVLAQANGDLQDIHTKKEYYALFWEANTAQSFKFDEGFSVAGAETANFLDTKLAELGLTRREANEFIMFWLPQMENNPYNTIHFATEDYTNRHPLEISPRPDALIRVFMVFQPTNALVKIPAQTFNTPKRTGFTVVEWGGTEQSKQAE